MTPSYNNALRVHVYKLRQSWFYSRLYKVDLNEMTSFGGISVAVSFTNVNYQVSAYVSIRLDVLRGLLSSQDPRHGL